MSTNVSIVISSNEESHCLQISSSDELFKYITNNLKIQHFNLITEKGEKINKKNITKLNEYFNSFNQSLSFLLIPSSIHTKNEVNGITPHTIKYYIDNQRTIKTILNYYFRNNIDKINNKLQLLNSLQMKYAKHKYYLDNDFNVTFNHFKTFFNTNDNIQIDFEVIEQGIKDFNKIACLYQEQLKSINMQAKDIISNYEWNINDNTLREDKEEMSLNDRIKIRTFNSHLLQTIIENEDNAKKEMLNKIAEITLYKKSLEHDIDITNIPKMFIEDHNEIQNEGVQRKNFDVCFGKIMNYVQNIILVKEEERRKAFCNRLYLQDKNELYTKFINVLYENNNVYQTNTREVDKNISEVLLQLDEQLNCLITALYKDNNYKVKTKNYNDFQYDNKSSNTMQIIHNEISKILKDNYKLSINQNEMNLPLDSKIMSMLKTLYEKTTSSIGGNNLCIDISNASLAYSILLDEKHQSNLNLSSHQNPDPNYVSIEMEKFVMKYEDKLYFYDSLYDFINAFIKHNKIKLITDLCKDNPQSLGNTIEQLLKEWLTIRKKYNKCLSLIKLLKK